MSSTVKWDVNSSFRKLGRAALSTTDAETVYFDFGTPDNIALLGNANYKPGDRVFAVFTTDSDGTTSAITAVIQDADDSSGSIGTPATAVTSGTLLLGTGDKYDVFGVKVQNGRPWLKLGVTNSSATDTVVCTCTVWAAPSNA